MPEFCAKSVPLNATISNIKSTALIAFANGLIQKQQILTLHIEHNLLCLTLILSGLLNYAPKKKRTPFSPFVIT